MLSVKNYLATAISLIKLTLIQLSDMLIWFFALKLLCECELVNVVNVASSLGDRLKLSQSMSTLKIW